MDVQGYSELSTCLQNCATRPNTFHDITCSTDGVDWMSFTAGVVFRPVIVTLDATRETLLVEETLVIHSCIMATDDLSSRPHDSRHKFLLYVIPDVARRMGLHHVAVYSTDDSHVRKLEKGFGYAACVDGSYICDLSMMRRVSKCPILKQLRKAKK